MQSSVNVGVKRQRIVFDEGLIRRYDQAGPRYTSYPTAPHFHEGFDEHNYANVVQESNGELLPRPLSIYFHLPFCARVCFYCACNKIITANRRKAELYVEYLIRELNLHADMFDNDRQVQQIHWGGGTPTFLTADLMTRIIEATHTAFSLADDHNGEYSIEIDPREATPDSIAKLRQLGFNRLSIGVQDFDPVVQAAVNRIQTYDETADIIHAGRDTGFHSISVDLIYGLPHQTVSSFDSTLDSVLALRPERIAVFNYAHLPHLFKSQRRIMSADLPSADQKIAILEHVIDKLTTEGYVYIGMDHFALPDDELAIAQNNNALRRNFQGYSTHAECDLIATGITAIGMIGDSYSQNVRGLDEYYKYVSEGKIPVFRGLSLTADDCIRRDVIMSLICNFRLDFSQVENEYRIFFKNYFAYELQQLKIMQDDGLLVIYSGAIIVQPAGKLLIRNICMVFDTYINRRSDNTYSRTI